MRICCITSQFSVSKFHVYVSCVVCHWSYIKNNQFKSRNCVDLKLWHSFGFLENWDRRQRFESTICQSRIIRSLPCGCSHRLRIYRRLSLSRWVPKRRLLMCLDERTRSTQPSTTQSQHSSRRRPSSSSAGIWSTWSARLRLSLRTTWRYEKSENLLRDLIKSLGNHVIAIKITSTDPDCSLLASVLLTICIFYRRLESPQRIIDFSFLLPSSSSYTLSYTCRRKKLSRYKCLQLIVHCTKVCLYRVNNLSLGILLRNFWLPTTLEPELFIEKMSPLQKLLHKKLLACVSVTGKSRRIAIMWWRCT